MLLLLSPDQIPGDRAQLRLLNNPGTLSILGKTDLILVCLVDRKADDTEQRDTNHFIRTHGSNLLPPLGLFETSS